MGPNDNKLQYGAQMDTQAMKPHTPLQAWHYAVLSIILVLYVGWPNAVFVESEDTLVFMSRILDGAPKLHANHLLFEPLYHAMLQLCLTVWPDADPVLTLQRFTTVFALSGLGAGFFLILPRAGTNAAVLGVGLMGSAFAFWHYSKVVDAYVPALAIALWSLVIFDRRHSLPGPVLAASLALLAAAATLIHQLYFFHVVMLFGALMICGSGWHGRLRDGAIYVGLTGGSLLALYWLAYVSSDGGALTLRDFLRWSLGLAKNGLWVEPSTQSPLLATIGFATALIYLTPAFGIPYLQSLADNVAGGRLLDEEAYIAREALGQTLSIAVFAMSVLAAILCLWLAARMLRNLRRSQPDATEAYLVVFIVFYAIVATVWEAANREFWIHVLAGLTLLVAMRLRVPDAERDLRPGFLAFALLGSANFLGAIQPLSNSDNDYWRVTTAPIVAELSSGDVVVVNCPWLCANYLEYLSGAQVYLYDQLVDVDVPPAASDWRAGIQIQTLDPVTLQPASP
ncbi:hypothetical protein [Jannaschia sp. CCS1]|uniref:hypothetical protein n=1 Tax=Jannaschia sp. (strain CCS1) TaxID=290400 RepID=UPI000053BFA4|nr:hypothetical protein [Jannaschia sp. CCS1]ABD57159.1 hypothetical protein Jann_4243 [Jannaschia sp. CCS1]